MAEPTKEPLEKDLSLPFLVASDIRANPRNKLS